MLVFLGVLCLALLFSLFVAVIFLLWLRSHPMVLIRRIRNADNIPKDSIIKDENIVKDNIIIEGNAGPADGTGDQAKVKIAHNLIYPSRFGSNNFDLYLPKEYPIRKKIPVVVWIHGGSFIAGDKDGVKTLANRIAASGYAVAAINYEVAPEARYPAAVIQVNEFFAKLLSMEEEYPGLALNKIFLSGDSAGAQIAAQYGAVLSNPALEKEMEIVPSVARSRISGMILCCGPYDLPAIRKVKNYKLRYLLSIWGYAYFGCNHWHKCPAAAQTVISRQVTLAYPPCYITDGNTNSFEVQGRRLGEALRANKVPVYERYFDLTDAAVDHNYLFDPDNERALTTFHEIIEFIKRYE